MTAISPAASGAAASSPVPHPDERILVDLWAWKGPVTVVVRRCHHAQRRVAHTVLTLSRHGEVHTAHTSISPASPIDLPPLRPLREAHELVVGDRALALSARVRWVPTSETSTEPMVVLDGPNEHLRDDVAATCGEFSGAIELDGEVIDLSGWKGVGERRVGVVPADLPPGPLERPHDELPTRVWLRVLLCRPDGPATFTYSCDRHGRPQLATAWTPTHGPVPVDGDRVRLGWWAGSRRPRAIRIPALPGDSEPVELQVRWAAPAAILGGLGATWPLAGWVGSDAARRVRQVVDVNEHWSATPWGSGPLAGVAHHGVADVVGSSVGTSAVMEVTVLGPHEASGLSGWTAGA